MRFSMPAYTSFCQLAVKEEHPDVLFTKRGMITRRGLRTIIVPLSGKSVSDLFDAAENSKVYQDIHILESIAEFLREGLQKIRDNTKAEEANDRKQTELFRRIHDSASDKSLDEIMSQLAEKFHYIKADIENLISDNIKESGKNISIGEETDKERYFMEILEFCLLEDSENHLSEDTVIWMEKYLVPGWKVLCGEIENLMKDTDYLLNSVYNESDDVNLNNRISAYIREHFAFSRSPLCKEHDTERAVSIERAEIESHDEEVKETLIRYVQKNSWVGSLTYEQVKQMYEAMTDEMLYCIVILPVEEKIEKVRRYYQIF